MTSKFFFDFTSSVGVKYEGAALLKSLRYSSTSLMIFTACLGSVVSLRLVCCSFRTRLCRVSLVRLRTRLVPEI